MILDSRIKAGKKPLTCFDTEEASKFVDKKGYFSDCLYNFQNLDNCSKSILHCIDDKREDSNDYIFNDGKYYCRFFLPEEWTDQKSKINFEQYRLVSAEHNQIEEWRKKEILRELQAPKSLKDFKREMIAETFQGENYLMQQMIINSRISKQENNTNEISQQITRSKNNDI